MSSHEAAKNAKERNVDELSAKELNPAGETTVVFCDSAFVDDVAKINLAAILHPHGLETVRSL